MTICLSVLALYQTGNLSRVCHASLPMIARLGFSCLHDPDKDKRTRMDGWMNQIKWFHWQCFITLFIISPNFFVCVCVCVLSHRLLLMFGVSAGVAVCNYFIPSTLGVVLLSTAMGFLLSLDLSQVGTLCRGSRSAFGDRELLRGGPSPPPPTSFGWNLGCREVLLYLSLLLVAMAEAGVLHHFIGSAQSRSLITGPQAPVSYLLLILFCLCWALREIQGAYVFGGVFLNPLYPKGMSNVHIFKQRNRGLYIAAAIRRVLIYLGEVLRFL